MSPLTEATIIEKFKFIGNDKRNQMMSKTLLKHQ